MLPQVVNYNATNGDDNSSYMLVAMETRTVSSIHQKVNFGHFTCQYDNIGRLLRPSFGDFRQNIFLVPLVLRLSRTPYRAPGLEDIR